ncbi:hypothetical protein LQE88_03800 [Acidaminococcus sp. NSJ-142]|jgi:thiosulfate reductase cytochrome b subunit|uniref:hypothetical protein n=1 Tax=Acidaminococcus TaxID=904 RepID=UPI001E2E119B|nr:MULTISPECIES: hypothetical protein [Acidaminococcus]MCD2435115.1 hypothetical protein [Acidaminococcus hominis]
MKLQQIARWLRVHEVGECIKFATISTIYVIIVAILFPLPMLTGLLLYILFDALGISMSGDTMWWLGFIVACAPGIIIFYNDAFIDKTL